MESNKRTLTINPELFKLSGGKKNNNKTKNKKIAPTIEEKEVKNINKTKKELLKKVKDYQKNKETEKLNKEKEEKKENYPTNLFETNEFENSDFEREFNKSLSFLQNLEKKNKEKKKKKHTQKIPFVEVSMDLPNNLEKNEPSYGCLKNGNKPTYNQLNKTQKRENSGKRITISLENNDSDDNPREKKQTNNVEENIEVKTDFEELIDKKIENINAIETNTNNTINNIEPLESIITDNNIETINLPKDLKSTINENENTIISINENLIDSNSNINSNSNSLTEIDITKLPKINRVTRKKKYILGKKKDSKQVGILLKNRETQKNVKAEVSSLKSKSIQEIKDYLRKKNLIKLGSESPNDVLRKLYEDSILAGDVQNDNSEVLMHNFLN